MQVSKIKLLDEPEIKGMGLEDFFNFMNENEIKKVRDRILTHNLKTKLKNIEIKLGDFILNKDYKIRGDWSSLFSVDGKIEIDNVNYDAFVMFHGEHDKDLDTTLNNLLKKHENDKIEYEINTNSQSIVFNLEQFYKQYYF